MYESEFLTAGLTIVGGVIVYVIGELLNQFMIKPVVALREEIGRIASSLVYYANVYTSGSGISRDIQLAASNELRMRAAELRAKMNNISEKRLRRYKLSKKQLQEASAILIGLSNSLFSGEPLENKERREKIERLLNIEI